jgi:hypothetical protein
LLDLTGAKLRIRTILSSSVRGAAPWPLRSTVLLPATLLVHP